MWEERFKHKSEREKSEGEKGSPPTLFLFFTDFYYYFNWLKILFLFFFCYFLTFGLKMFFLPFLANDCDLFLHIMLALRYYHSMMLRGDQSLLRGHNYSTETTSCWHAPRPLCNTRILKGRSEVGIGVLFYLNWFSSPMSDTQLDSLLATVSSSFF